MDDDSMDDDSWTPLVKFYGPYDLSVGWQLTRVTELIAEFDPDNPPTATQDLIELHNVQQYIDHDLLPATYSEEERNAAISKASAMRSAIAKHFSKIDDQTFAAQVEDVDWQYHDDLIDLLGRCKAFERCDSSIVIAAFTGLGIHLTTILANKSIVKAYDTTLCDLLCGTPEYGEIVIKKHLGKPSKNEPHLPSSFTAEHSRKLIEEYVQGESANPNYVKLVAEAKPSVSAGIDAKLILKAKRRHKEMMDELFKENSGMKMGYGVSLSDSQEEPVLVKVDTSDGWEILYTYSAKWLDETLDAPSILNNIQHLFELTDGKVLLNLPSYPAQLGVMESLMGIGGKSDYVIGGAFRLSDSTSFLQIHLYLRYLESKDIYLEDTVKWFFEEYIVQEFGAENFSFTPSDTGASWLSRVRHLFAEMESVANQFSVYAAEGELDRDLLSISGDQVRYKEIPSLIERKYAYADQTSPIVGVLNLLFSDQSPVHYINEGLNGPNLTRLLIDNVVPYEQFHDHQQHSIDYLIENGVLENTGSHIKFANYELLLVLHSLYEKRAVNYYRLSPQGQIEVDHLVARGWASFASTLLTTDEGAYFNYFLNTVDHTNGPQLRNKYLHGTQMNGETENEHATSYLKALRLLLALVIKINDEFCLNAAVEASAKAPLTADSSEEASSKADAEAPRSP